MALRILDWDLCMRLCWTCWRNPTVLFRSSVSGIQHWTANHPQPRTQSFGLSRPHT